MLLGVGLARRMGEPIGFWRGRKQGHCGEENAQAFEEELYGQSEVEVIGDRDAQC